MTSPTLLDTLQPVELADGVTVQVRVAGPPVRALAWLIDLLIAVCCYVAMGIAMSLLGAFTSGTIGQGVYLLFLFVFNWFYNVIFEMGKHSATPGQRAMGLKVTSVSGTPVRLPQSLIRNLLRVVDFMPSGYLVGLITSLSNRRFQRLGDLVADTVVVYADEKRKHPQAFGVNVDPTPPPVALSREERAAILEFMERAPGWSDERRVEMADLLQDLTGATGMGGLRKLCGMGLWLTEGGSKTSPTGGLRR